MLYNILQLDSSFDETIIPTQSSCRSLKYVVLMLYTLRKYRLTYRSSYRSSYQFWAVFYTAGLLPEMMIIIHSVTVEWAVFSESVYM